jgi:hypothetical protein
VEAAERPLDQHARREDGGHRGRRGRQPDRRCGDAAPLNGIQITAAIDVLTKVTEKTIDETAATELLARVGIAPDRRRRWCQWRSKREGISPAIVRSSATCSSNC